MLLWNIQNGAQLGVFVRFVCLFVCRAEDQLVRGDQSGDVEKGWSEGEKHKKGGARNCIPSAGFMDQEED